MRRSSLVSENGLAEAHQELTMRHAAVTITGGDDRETVVFALCFALARSSCKWLVVQ